MGKIRILEDHVVNCIAAGEVVERPASVVKELVENSLDAGARRVEVELESGGRTLVGVTDDGRGMDRQDVLMCIERHGTSKLRTEEDLNHVSTLGFRGEAMPSIAAVSRFELTSRPADQEVGTRLAVHGGKIQPPEPAGCPVGTRVMVRALFYNVPARRKFLRAAGTELGHCVDAVVREALIRPELDWTVTHDGRALLRAPAVKTRAARAAELLNDQGQALFPFELSSGNATIEALLSPVGVHHANAAGAMFLYVNGRYVRDLTLRKAVNEAYRHIVPKGRYPTVVLELRLPSDEVDVNVHPSKVEVRFRDTNDVFRFVADGLRDALERHGLRRVVPVTPYERPPQPSLLASPTAGYDAGPPPPRVAPTPGRQRNRPHTQPGYTPPSPPHTPPRPPDPVVPVVAAAPAQAEPPPPPPPEAAPPPRSRNEPMRSDPALPVPRFQDLRVIGQLVGTYILCEGAGELVILDQHAAHERVTLYRLQQHTRERLGAAQRLLTPVIVELPLSRAAVLETHLDALRSLNLEVEPYGGASFAISAVPPGLASADLARLLRDLADELVEGGAGLAGRDLAERVLATMACHNSIRAHHTLSPYEMRELLKALDGVDFSVCAHGRPVAIRVDQRELERRFHRA
ncbi:MAG: DNA mismatch repair endonuclease MutL [Deltaproteobacteria bacterium]|nr:DNA mismatch repair endonuclease MutL [Deltaproteobacteria bacterium]